MRLYIYQKIITKLNRFQNKCYDVFSEQFNDKHIFPRIDYLHKNIFKRVTGYDIEHLDDTLGKVKYKGYFISDYVYDLFYDADEKDSLKQIIKAIEEVSK